MRSQVKVLAGPPAKALPERPPATPLDHLGPLGPAPAQQLPFWRRLSGRRLEVHTAAGHPGWVTCYKIVRPCPQQQLRVVYRQVEDPAGSLAASTRPDLAWRARLSGAGAETPAQPEAQLTSTTVTKTTQIGSSGGIARPLTKWSLLGEILPERPAPIDLEASGGPASGQRGANDQEGRGPGDAGRRCQAPPGHPAAPDYPGTDDPTEDRRWASTSRARAARRYRLVERENGGPRGWLGLPGARTPGGESRGHPLGGRNDLTVGAGVGGQ